MYSIQIQESTLFLGYIEKMRYLWSTYSSAKKSAEQIECTRDKELGLAKIAPLDKYKP